MNKKITERGRSNILLDEIRLQQALNDLVLESGCSRKLMNDLEIKFENLQKAYEKFKKG